MKFVIRVLDEDDLLFVSHKTSIHSQTTYYTTHLRYAKKFNELEISFYRGWRNETKYEVLIWEEAQILYLMSQ
jgi:hypothetical protein